MSQHSDSTTAPYPSGTIQPQPIPGKTLGIVSVILPFVGLGLVGFILGLVAKSKSKKAGIKNTPAVVGIVLGAISLVVGIIVTIAIIVGISAAANLAQQCQQLGPGAHETNGVTITCGS